MTIEVKDKSFQSPRVSAPESMVYLRPTWHQPNSVQVHHFCQLLLQTAGLFLAKCLVVIFEAASFPSLSSSLPM
jgi:hypothetical protein